jgi:hypothetical protein
MMVFGTRNQGFPRERYAPWRPSSRRIFGEIRGNCRSGRIFRRTLAHGVRMELGIGHKLSGAESSTDRFDGIAVLDPILQHEIVRGLLTGPPETHRRIIPTDDGQTDRDPDDDEREFGNLGSLRGLNPCFL